MMKWIIDNETFEDADDAARYITDNMSDDAYDEMLDECYEEIEICGCSYSPSLALYKVDPIAYNCGKSDYYDSLTSDISYEIDRMDDEEEMDFYGFTVSAIWEDEDEDEDEEPFRLHIFD